MKKQLSKITLKTDKIVHLSKKQTQQVEGAQPAPAPCRTARDFSCKWD